MPTRPLVAVQQTIQPLVAVGVGHRAPGEAVDLLAHRALAFCDLHGVEAVIDKDLASALLARRLGADLFVISTNVQKVCLKFGKPDQRALGRVTVDEAKRYLAEGHFGAGSMAPKIQGIIRFLESGGRRAIVTCPPDLEDAVAGNAGTEFVAP